MDIIGRNQIQKDFGAWSAMVIVRMEMRSVSSNISFVFVRVFGVV